MNFKFYRFYFLLLSIFAFSSNSFAQLTVSGGTNATTLVQNTLLGTGVTATNITYSGSNQALGTFNGANSNIGLSSGIILCTGQINLATGPNNAGGSGNDNNGNGDPDLDALSGFQTFDAGIIEFDFIPLNDTVTFRYVFASEEYNEYVCGTVNDVFGFFVSGPGIVGAQNLAVLPVSGTQVSINTVNNGSVGSNGSASNSPCILSNAGFFVDNDNPPGPTVQYDGFTTVLTATMIIQPCTTYHIKIAIADGGDGVFDSAVFLEANSFSSGIPVSAVAAATNNGIGCIPYVCTFNNLSVGTNSFIWDFGDNSLPDTSSNPTHVYTVPGNYTVTLIADDTTQCDFSDTLYLSVQVGSPNVIASFNQAGNGACDSLQLNFTNTSSGADLYTWDLGDGTYSTSPTTVSNTYYTGTWQVTMIATDTLCNASDTAYSTIEIKNRLTASLSYDMTSGCEPLTVNFCGGNAFSSQTIYQWSFGNNGTSVVPCDSSVYADAGNYIAKLVMTDSSSCNINDTALANVRVFAVPQVDFILPDSLNYLYQAEMDNRTVDGLNYTWTFGDGDGSYQFNPTHQYLKTGLYDICLISEANGCLDTLCKPLKIFEVPQELWFPNAFTPNGDGINELFIPPGIGIASYEITVFNRFGGVVFSAFNNGAWDGSFQGEPVQAGVYPYIYKAVYLDGQKVEKQGAIQLVR